MVFVCLNREAIKKNNEIYEKLALFELEEKYGKTEGGKYFGCAIYPPNLFGHSTNT